MRRLVYFAAAVATSACAAVLGLPDRGLDPLDPNEANEASTDGSAAPDDAGLDSSSSTDSAVDGGACDADIAVDPRNCGRCVHDCLGGTCAAGRCEPYVFSSSTGPIGVTLDATYVYTGLGNGDIVRKKKSDRDGAAGTLLVSSAEPRYLAINPEQTTLFFSRIDNSPSVSSLPIDGGPRVNIGGNLADPRGIVFFGAALFVVNASTDSVVRLDRTNGTNLDSKTYGSDLDGLAADGQHLYIAIPGMGEIRRTTGLPADEVFDTNDAGVTTLAIDDTDVYMGAPGQVLRRRKDRSAAREKVADSPGIVSGITVDATAIYWANATSGRIMRLAK